MKLSAAKLNELIEDAIVDAYGESEQRVAFYTVIDENLALHSSPAFWAQMSRSSALN